MIGARSPCHLQHGRLLVRNSRYGYHIRVQESKFSNILSGLNWMRDLDCSLSHDGLARVVLLRLLERQIAVTIVMT
jgi:hypothetical protein